MLQGLLAHQATLQQAQQTIDKFERTFPSLQQQVLRMKVALDKCVGTNRGVLAGLSQKRAQLEQHCQRLVEQQAQLQQQRKQAADELEDFGGVSAFEDSLRCALEYELCLAPNKPQILRDSVSVLSIESALQKLNFALTQLETYEERLQRSDADIVEQTTAVRSLRERIEAKQATYKSYFLVDGSKNYAQLDTILMARYTTQCHTLTTNLTRSVTTVLKRYRRGCIPSIVNKMLVSFSMSPDNAAVENLCRDILAVDLEYTSVAELSEQLSAWIHQAQAFSRYCFRCDLAQRLRDIKLQADTLLDVLPLNSNQAPTTEEAPLTPSAPEFGLFPS